MIYRKYAWAPTLVKDAKDLARRALPDDVASCEEVLGA